MSKFRKIADVSVFLLLVGLLFAMQLILPAQTVSYAERRKLESKPPLKAETVFSGEYMQELEAYLLDQFPLRDDFRTIKALTRFGLFMQSDNNGVYIVDGSVSKTEYPLKPNQVEYAANKLNSICEQYFADSRIFYSVIPDKNYFIAEQNGYPALDYEEMIRLFTTTFKYGEYIDIFPCLDVKAYYATDAHWRQEAIFPVANALTLAMGVNDDFISMEDCTAHTIGPFYGVYYGQSALPLRPDAITYMTNPAIDASTVTGVEFEGERPVYMPELISGMDGYDVYLSGAQAILTINNPLAANDRELIIFRDSFGSSITPLLISAYSKITVVDIRYANSSILGQYIDFNGQDVLFLYSTTILNSGMLLK